MKKFGRLTQEEIGALIAMLATIFGGWVRLFAPAIAGFPINDGGLFYVMMRSIQQDHFRLPAFIQYNGLNIPFAYPPLGLYTGAVLSSFLHLNLLDMVRWLPAVVLIFTIPAFYLLSKTILDSGFKAGVAALIFALTPRSMTWPIMGGGVTRSFGYLFLLLTLANVHLLFTRREKKYLVFSILFSTLTVLSHPEAALQAVGLSLLLWILKGRDRAGTLYALYVGVGTLALSAIWWLPLLLRFGPDPLLAAAQTGSHSPLALLYPLFAVLTDEPLMTIVAALAAIGFFVCIAQKKYLLPAWYFLPFLIEPRSSPTFAMIHMAMLASVSLTDIILPALANLEGQARQAACQHPFQSRTVQALMIFIGFYLLGSAFYFDTKLAGTALAPSHREAFDWISANTPPDSRFLVITGESKIFCDGVSEWFPALTNRIGTTTIQGNEWLADKRFATISEEQGALQGCPYAVSPLSCVEQVANQFKLQYEYIYVAEPTSANQFCLGDVSILHSDILISALEQDNEYKLVYSINDAAVFSFDH